jgi:hypothetical protein
MEYGEYMRKKKEVPVVDESGNLLCMVSEAFTSVGVSRLAAKRGVKGKYQFGTVEVDGQKYWGWRPRTKSLADIINITFNSSCS